ncbi:MAG: 4-hydroxythreonine-4-phosphate dehydrogenase PdxA [Erythrobacter sp.]|nr:MAG: 4-hydroxythreonine-4-phosphate dehydrogenase PdxA [Erythrobacter sp.]
MQVPLAVTLGDPAGVGPEVIVASWAARDREQLPPFFVQKGAGILRAAAEMMGLDVPVIPIHHPAEAYLAFPEGLPVNGLEDCDNTPGSPNEMGASLAHKSLIEAYSTLSNGVANGIVTAPVSKSRLSPISPGFIGQTEFFADKCGVARDKAVMMLAGPSLRTVPMTVHCALAEVPGRLSQDLIVTRSRVVARALQSDYGIAAPRIAIAGLNPHAGEDGRMGREEIDIIAPAIAQLRAEGIDATGPHPADTLFAPHKRGSYDVAIAMYHDQALVPLKALDFDEGVNVTLGLPIVRTSPDHGTAFDIAGKGIARPNAMIAAIRMAGAIAARRAHG